MSVGNTLKTDDGFYWLTCPCGSSEPVSKPEGKCEGCGTPYKLRVDEEESKPIILKWFEITYKDYEPTSEDICADNEHFDSYEDAKKDYDPVTERIIKVTVTVEEPENA